MSAVKATNQLMPSASPWPTKNPSFSRHCENVIIPGVLAAMQMMRRSRTPTRRQPDKYAIESNSATARWQRLSTISDVQGQASSPQPGHIRPSQAEPSRAFEPWATAWPGPARHRFSGISRGGAGNVHTVYYGMYIAGVRVWAKAQKHSREGAPTVELASSGIREVEDRRTGRTVNVDATGIDTRGPASWGEVASMRLKTGGCAISSAECDLRKRGAGEEPSSRPKWTVHPSARLRDTENAATLELRSHQHVKLPMVTPHTSPLLSDHESPPPGLLSAAHKCKRAPTADDKMVEQQKVHHVVSMLSQDISASDGPPKDVTMIDIDEPSKAPQSNSKKCCKCKMCLNHAILVVEVSTLWRHLEANHWPEYMKWAKANSFVSMLPKDRKSQKDESQTSQTELNPHLRPVAPKERILPVNWLKGDIVEALQCLKCCIQQDLLFCHQDDPSVTSEVYGITELLSQLPKEDEGWEVIVEDLELHEEQDEVDDLNENIDLAGAWAELGPGLHELRRTRARAVPSPEPVLEGNSGHEDGSQGPESQSSTPDEDPTPRVACGAGFKASPTELAEHTVVSSGLLPRLTVQLPSDDPTPSVGMSCSHSDASSTGSLIPVPRKKPQKGKEKDVVLPNVLSRISSHLAAEAPQALPSHASSSLSGPGCPGGASLVFSLRPSSFTPSFASVTAGSFLAGPSNRIHTLGAALALPFSEVVPSASSRS
ncbi:hypothetical protein V8E55_008612 [Tylopilus felleus]